MIRRGSGDNSAQADLDAPVSGAVGTGTVRCLTGNGLTAADSVVVISESRMASASGLAKLLDTVGQVQQFYNPALAIAGIIVNKHEEGTRTGRHWLPEIETAAEAREFPRAPPSGA